MSCFLEGRYRYAYLSTFLSGGWNKSLKLMLYVIWDVSLQCCLLIHCCSRRVEQIGHRWDNANVMKKNMPCFYCPRNDLSNLCGLAYPDRPICFGILQLHIFVCFLWGYKITLPLFLFSFYLTSFNSPYIHSADPGRLITVLEPAFKLLENKVA